MRFNQGAKGIFATGGGISPKQFIVLIHRVRRVDAAEDENPTKNLDLLASRNPEQNSLPKTG
jgi:hypothetical protein